MGRKLHLHGAAQPASRTQTALEEQNQNLAGISVTSGTKQCFLPSQLPKWVCGRKNKEVKLLASLISQHRASWDGDC